MNLLYAFHYDSPHIALWRPIFCINHTAKILEVINLELSVWLNSLQHTRYLHKPYLRKGYNRMGYTCIYRSVKLSLLQHIIINILYLLVLRKFGKSIRGWMAEWFKVPVLKIGVRVCVPWVRIPLHPPDLVRMTFLTSFCYSISNAQNPSICAPPQVFI